MSNTVSGSTANVVRSRVPSVHSSKVAPHPAMFDLLEVTDHLFLNQTEPDGKPSSPGLEKSLQLKAKGLLNDIAREDSLSSNREIARLCRESMADPRNREDIDRLLVEEFIRQPDIPYTFLVGDLCNQASLQREKPRAQGRRFSGWLWAPDARGQKIVDGMLTPSRINAILPKAVRPREADMRVSPPIRHRVLRTLGASGEAGRAGHVATFFPEDQGTPPRGRKWTAFFLDRSEQRFKSFTRPLWISAAHPLEVSAVMNMSDDAKERALVAMAYGHELGHVSGAVPLKLNGYPGLGGCNYPVLEELRADLLWLWTTRLDRKLLPSEKDWRNQMRMMCADFLRYVRSGLGKRADAASAYLTLNFLRSFRAVHISADLYLSLDFDRLHAGIEELLIRTTHIIEEGNLRNAEDFCAELNLDLPQRIMKRADPFMANILNVAWLRPPLS